MKRFVTTIAVLAAAGLLGYWATHGALDAHSAAEKRVEAPSGRSEAPDFKVKGLDGKPIQLSAMKGKVVVLDFWATWCPPCKAEIPHFIELQNAYGSKGIQIVGLSLDQEGEAVVRPFAQSFGINYPVAVVGQDLAQKYGGIRGIPTTFLVDKQGRVAKKYVGYQDKAVFETQIQALLAE